MAWGYLAAIVAGTLYGWLKPGRQTAAQIFKTGIPLGFVLAVVLAVIGLMTQSSPLGLPLDSRSLAAAALAMCGLFALSVWIGDLLERPASNRSGKARGKDV